MVAPVLSELAEKYSGKLDVYKVNTEEEQQLSALFGIQSIPTLLFVPVSGKPTMAQGALPKENMEQIIKDVLGVL